MHPKWLLPWPCMNNIPIWVYVKHRSSQFTRCNVSVCSAFGDQLAFRRMQKTLFVLPVALLFACPVLFAQTSSSDPLAPTQGVKSAEQIDREWQQSVSKYDAERNRLV